MPTDPSTSLFFTTSGTQGATPVVFLHGGGASSWMWQKVTAQLSDYFCLAPDLPEQGHSQNAGPFGIERAADLVANLICSQVSQQKAILVGLSEGAQVVVSMLSRCPEVMERAFVSSALVRPLPGASMVTPGLLAWSFRSSVAPFRNSDFWIRLNMKYAAGIPEEYYPQFNQEFHAMTEPGFVHMMHANLTFRLPTGLEHVAIPTLVVTGKHEYAAMRRSGRDLAAVLPGGKACTLDLGPGSSLAKEHNWALTAPELFARSVRAWIEGSPLPAEVTPSA